MTSHKGRDLLLKIGDGGSPEAFTEIGSARMTSLSLSNPLLDVTALDGGGLQALKPDGGVQAMQVRLDGLFRDEAGEEALRAAAFGRSLGNYKFVFPNGDVYAAAFAVQGYTRGGRHDGLETFTLTLNRSGGGIFTPGA
jgi:predicted secreted protein